MMVYTIAFYDISHPVNVGIAKGGIVKMCAVLPIYQYLHSTCVIHDVFGCGLVYGLNLG